jgi:methionyl-tRNA formyltransferase
MRLVFFGTPLFSVPFLSALQSEPDFELAAVVAQPDKPVGRGYELIAPPTITFAREHLIPTHQFATLKSNDAEETLRGLNADAFVVVAYGKLIPKTILSMPLLGCINVHPSLLPRHRGPAPMQAAIKEGDVQTGVTIMLLDEGMDTGPLLASETIQLDSEETYPSLEKKVQAVGGPLLVQTLKRVGQKEIIPLAQDDANATVTRLLERDDGHLDWKQPMEEIDRIYRAYQPWPGTWSIWNDSRLKWIELRPVDFRADVLPGTVTVKEGRLFVDASNGTVEILRIQPEGKAAMTAAEFIRGHDAIQGAVLR